MTISMTPMTIDMLPQHIFEKRVFVYMANVTKELTDTLWGFNGGFSCKSFSKLHPDWVGLQRAIFEDLDATWVQSEF